METETIPDIPNDNPETYCRLCFSGFYVEPLFPPDGQPRQGVIELIGRLVDIHVTMEMDYRCAVCRMCQMTLEGFHKYRERCRTLDDVLQRKRMELMHYQVKVEHQEELAQNAIGFEEDMVYCLSDSDEENAGGGGDGEEGGDGGEEELERGLIDDDGEEIDEEVEEELIRGDVLIKPEPYGMEEGGGGREGGDHFDEDQQDHEEEQDLPDRKPARNDVVVLDSEEDEKSMEASMEESTRASSEARTEDQGKDIPKKTLPFEVSSDGAYRCTICQETFRLMKEIKNHIRKTHPDQAMIYSCRYCAKKFCETTSLRAHTRFHTMDFPFSCDECGAKFTMKARLDNHVSRYHDKNSPSYTDKRYKCTLCPRIFLQESGRNLHILHFHDTKPSEVTEVIPMLQVLYCDGCNEQFDTKEAIDAHFAEHHAGEDEESKPKISKRHKCPDCAKVFRHRTALRSHCVINHGTMPHKCDICGSSFERKTKLDKHKANWHGENSKNKVLERYKCDQCDRYFVRNQDRFRHEQVVHNIESPAKLPTVWEGRKSNFPCSKCDRKFPSMKTMRIHFALKHPDVPVRFKCTVCSKLFKHKTSLREHMMNHTGEHPFGCDQCDERFIRKKDVDRHMQEMHGSDDEDSEKKVRFPCPHCPRKLTTKTARAIHITHHHADKEPLAKQVLSSLPKSMACHHCKKVFTNRNTLKLHILNHLGKLPHQCQQCDAGFYKPADLLRHKQRYHTGGSSLTIANRFKCAYCPRIFIRKSARRYHHTVFHGIEKKNVAGSSSSSHKGIKAEPENVEYPCGLCSLVFVTGTMLQTHHQQQHPDQQFFYKCPHCPKRTVHRNAYVSHIRLHVGGYRYPCDQCNVKFDRKVLLVQHKQRYHSDSSKDVQRFLCMICNREFLRNQDRVRHQIVVHNYQVQGSGSQPAPSPGPSSSKKSLLKIKQEKQQLDVPAEPVDGYVIKKASEGFAISSDVEEIEDDDDEEGGVEQQQQKHLQKREHQSDEDDQVSGEEGTVPTISNVVSIKEEVIAARKEYNDYTAEF